MKYPDGEQNLIASLITGVIVSTISLPKSILDLLKITKENDATYSFVYLIAYWSIYLAHMILIFKKKAITLFVSFSALNIMSSINWFVVSWAYMGV